MSLLFSNRNLLEVCQNGINPYPLQEKARRNEFNRWTGEKREAMYDNVLKYPKGNEHLKYFEKNPHPDKFSDTESFLFEAFNKPQKDNSISAKRIEFERIKKYLEPKLSEFEKELLSLPDVMQKGIDTFNDRNYRIAFTHLRDCFINYFITSTDKAIIPDIQWIEPDFISSCIPAQEAVIKLRNNLFNDAAAANLKAKLREAGAFTGQKKEFYLWNTSPYNWDDMSFQSRPVSWWNWDFLYEFLERLRSKWRNNSLSFTSLLMPNDIPPAQYAALGDFTINALPEGYVVPRGKGKYDICVNKMFYFINDSFNFEGLGDLSYWRLNKNDEYQPEETSTRLLENSDFQYFRRHGYGREFPVLSRLIEIEDFEPYCLENQNVE